MADNTNPEGKKTNSSDLLPKYFRTDANKKFLQATVDQLIQPGTVKKINGHIGRENSKATTSADIFIESPTKVRQQYQLEPGYTVSDTLDNITFFKDFFLVYHSKKNITIKFLFFCHLIIPLVS